MAQLQWQNMGVQDNSRYLEAIARAQQNTVQGIQGIGTAFEGFHNNLKQANTNEMLSILNQAKDQESLAQAQQQIAAIQQRVGTGYDLDKVRTAMDTRPEVLMQRESARMDFNDKQAALTARPMQAQMLMEQMKAAGATPEQLTQMQNMASTGADLNNFYQQQYSNLYQQQQANQQQANSDRTFNRGVLESDRTYALQRENQQFDQQRAMTQDTMKYAQQFAENELPTTNIVDSNGNLVTQSGGNKLSGYLGTAAQLGAGMYGTVHAESKGVHRTADGKLLRSPAGALGVAQIMPATAAKPGYGMPPINLETSSPEQQIQWANEYRNRMQKAHGFTEDQTTAAYNAGAGKVQSAIKAGGSNWKQHLPKETQTYIGRVNTAAGSLSGGGSKAVVGITQDKLLNTKSTYEEAKYKWNIEQAAKNQPLDPSRFDALKIGSESRSWFKTDDFDILDHLRTNETAKNLTQEQLQTVVDRVSNWRRDTKGPLTYVSSNGLKKHVNDTIANVAKTAKSADDKYRKENDPLNKAVLELQQEYRSAGGNISRANAIKLLDGEHYSKYYAPKQQVQAKPKPVSNTVTPQQVAKAESKPVPKATTTSSSSSPDWLKPAQEKAKAKNEAERVKRETDKAKELAKQVKERESIQVKRADDKAKQALAEAKAKREREEQMAKRRLQAMQANGGSAIRLAPTTNPWIK